MVVLPRGIGEELSGRDDEGVGILPRDALPFREAVRLILVLVGVEEIHNDVVVALEAGQAVLADEDASARAVRRVVVQNVIICSCIVCSIYNVKVVVSAADDGVVDDDVIGGGAPTIDLEERNAVEVIVVEQIILDPGVLHAVAVDPRPANDPVVVDNVLLDHRLGDETAPPMLMSPFMWIPFFWLPQTRLPRTTGWTQVFPM